MKFYRSENFTDVVNLSRVHLSSRHLIYAHYVSKSHLSGSISGHWSCDLPYVNGKHTAPNVVSHCTTVDRTTEGDKIVLLS